MEFKDVSEEVKRESQRVAVAFGVDSIQAVWPHALGTLFQGWITEPTLDPQGVELQAGIMRPGGELYAVDLWASSSHTSVERMSIYSKAWKVLPSIHQLNETMVRGLYRLGFEDDGVFAELKCLLTAEEKLELRLSMPREFWPKTWLDEEGE